MPCLPAPASGQGTYREFFCCRTPRTEGMGLGELWLGPPAMRVSMISCGEEQLGFMAAMAGRLSSGKLDALLFRGRPALLFQHCKSR